MKTDKKVIELIRVSTAAQAAEDKASIPAQRRVNRQTCASLGLEIVKSIEITDVSGASVLESPEMRQLIQLIKSPDIDGVVAREFSRLMRPEDASDYALLQWFADSNTVLYLPEGPIDLAHKTGKIMGLMRAAFAGLERTEMKERVWSAKEEKRRKGELGQSNIVLPFGVEYSKGRFSYKPEAQRVRQAFRRFLNGEQSYSKLARMVGVTARGMHLIMRNPIWTGWRVIDKKRDLSATGRYPTRGGRQGDRRKVARAPEDIIRIKVIDKPLISQKHFDAVQRMMDRKQTKHWRSRSLDRRFTYNGFLTCSACGDIIHTALARRDYYACKGRRNKHTCKTKYMSRERLETALDDLLTKYLTDPDFLTKCIAAARRRDEECDRKTDTETLRAEITRQQKRRTRVLDLHVDGKLGKRECNERLARIDLDLRSTQDLLAQTLPVREVDIHRLSELLAPLTEWKYWGRDQKRAVLAAILPDIRVADYQIESLGLNPALFSNEVTHTGRGSSQPPA